MFANEKRQKAYRRLSRFFTATEGNFAPIIALMAIPLIAAVGSAVDYSRLSKDNSRLQEAVDTAALAAAMIEGTDAEKTAIAGDLLTSNYDSEFFGTTVEFRAEAFGPRVKVASTAKIKSSILAAIKLGEINHQAVAVAEVGSLKDICLLSIAETGSSTIDIRGSARIKTNCGVQSNSTSASAITNSSSTTSQASYFCSSGGYTGTNYSSTPQTDCDPAIHPYASLPKPYTEGCDNWNFKTAPHLNTLSPGIYCGGLTATKGNIVFEAGLYIIKDGDLKITTNGAVYGEGVTFYLYGTSSLELSGGTVMELSAPKSGTYEGMLIVSHPDAGDGKRFKITGNTHTKLVGLSYFPNQQLSIGGTGNFGAASPFMSVVADTIEVHGSGEIEFSNNYEAAGYSGKNLPGRKIVYLIE